MQKNSLYRYYKENKMTIKQVERDLEVSYPWARCLLGIAKEEYPLYNTNVKPFILAKEKYGVDLFEDALKQWEDRGLATSSVQA